MLSIKNIFKIDQTMAYKHFASTCFPLWSANQLTGTDELTNIMVKGAVIDLLIVPWPYVLKNYILISKKIKDNFSSIS